VNPSPIFFGPLDKNVLTFETTTRHVGTIANKLVAIGRNTLNELLNRAVVVGCLIINIKIAIAVNIVVVLLGIGHPINPPFRPSPSSIIVSNFVIVDIFFSIVRGRELPSRGTAVGMDAVGDAGFRFGMLYSGDFARYSNAPGVFDFASFSRPTSAWV
jgi:hypothetical protein